MGLYDGRDELAARPARLRLRDIYELDHGFELSEPDELDELIVEDWPR